MSDSQSSVGSVRRGRHCFCGERAIILTSRTQENPGRRFWRCKNFKSADDCDFFDWIDLPSTDAKDIAIERLRVKISTLNGLVLGGAVPCAVVVPCAVAVPCAVSVLAAKDLTRVVLYFIGVENAFAAEEDVAAGHRLLLWPYCLHMVHLVLYPNGTEEEDDGIDVEVLSCVESALAPELRRYGQKVFAVRNKGERGPKWRFRIVRLELHNWSSGYILIKEIRVQLACLSGGIPRSSAGVPPRSKSDSYACPIRVSTSEISSYPKTGHMVSSYSGFYVVDCPIGLIWTLFSEEFIQTSIDSHPLVNLNRVSLALVMSTTTSFRELPHCPTTWGIWMSYLELIRSLAPRWEERQHALITKPDVRFVSLEIGNSKGESNPPPAKRGFELLRMKSRESLLARPRRLLYVGSKGGRS
ncbi:uncharacterized protein G2W53_035258 [Senna tora]|uniref:GRF-type domain-containing protein n=1 Tax=Senna tora TaxID=362788 RepID=A0A834ST93_9FABA|nr:uncharacterized protein G2W53_035258 [Senna tora]